MAEDFAIDLTGHELTRRALVAEAVMDETGYASDEVSAWKMLYSDLDEHQQQVYRMLVEKGVLPDEQTPS